MRKTRLDKDDSFSFWKKIIFVTIFFAIAPIALGTSLLSLLTITKPPERQATKSNPVTQLSTSGIQVFAALPPILPSVSGQVLGLDARKEIIRQYLTRHDSPLQRHADLVVATADKYDLDYRLITAIAMKESGLCKVIPDNSFNCWGWGIHSRGILKFDSYEEGIEKVSRGLKENYIERGYTTPEEIMKKYANPNSTTWADGVRGYMNQMQ
jgi:hypothetical protein